MSKKDKYLSSGAKALVKGNYKKALEFYKHALKEDSGDLDLKLKVADMYVRIGDKTSSIPVYQSVARGFAEKGFALKAVAVYKVLLSIDPDNISYIENLAGVYEQLQLKSEAQANLSLLIRHFEEKEDSEKVKKYLTRLVKMHPADLPYVKRYLKLHEEDKGLEAAFEEGMFILEQLKSESLIYEYTEIAEHLLSLDEDTELLLELSEIYISSNKHQSALEKLHLCYAKEKSNKKLLNLLCVVFEELRQYEKTIPVLKELIRVHKSEGNAKEVESLQKKLDKLNPRTNKKPGQLPQSPDLAISSKDQPVGIPSESSAGPLKNYDQFLSEADVYTKYGLIDKAIDHIKEGDISFPKEWRHKKVLVELYRNTGDSVLMRKAQEEMLERLVVLDEISEAKSLIEQILHGDPENQLALKFKDELSDQVEINIEEESIEIDFDDDSDLEDDLSRGQVRSIEMNNLEIASVHNDLEEELDMANFFIQQGMQDEAVSKLRQLKEFFNDDRIETLLKQVEREKKHEIIAEIPDDVEATFQRREDGDELVSFDFSRFLQKQMDDRIDLAKSCMSLGLYDKAHEILIKIKDTGYDQTEFYELLANCYEGKKDFHNCIKFLKSSLNFNDLSFQRQVSIYYQIGQVYEKWGDMSEAKYYYKMVLSRSPEYAGVAEKLQALEEN